MTGNPLLPAAAGAAILGLLILLISLWRRRSTTTRQLGVPLHVLAVAAALAVIGLLTPVDPADQGDRDRWLQLALAATVLAGLHLLAVYFFDGVLRGRRGYRIPPLIPRVVTLLVYAFGGLIAFQAIGGGPELGPLLATSAVTSLVLGLALQPILGNFFAGLVISLERPFRINDWVLVDDTEARVVDITWRATHLRTRDNDNLIIPNARIAEQKLVNFYYPHTLHLQRVRVGVHYRTPPYRVTEALLEAAREVPEILERPSPDVYLLEFADSSIVYELRIWIQDIADRPRVENRVRRNLWEVFRQHGITIPFPIRTIEIEPTANRLVSQPAAAQTTVGDETPTHDGHLFVEDGPDRGLSICLDGAVLVGRGTECDLILSDPHVSKTHLRVERVAAERAGHLQVIDVGGHGGTRVGERAVERHVLRPFDRIRLGETVLVYEPRSNPEPSR